MWSLPMTMLVDLFGSRLRSKVLAWLFTHPDQRYFGRELHSLLQEDQTNLSRELARLAETGILVCKVEGRQKYYQANDKCPIYEELKGLVVKTLGVTDVLRHALASLTERIKVAFVYGSFASGKQNLNSDVDLMVVGDVSFGDVVAATSPKQLKLGREINPTVYSEDEFRQKVKTGHHFLTAVLRDPKIFVVGDDHDLSRLVD
jgi:predicted nucleotidyltransferase